MSPAACPACAVADLAFADTLAAFAAVYVFLAPFARCAERILRKRAGRLPVFAADLGSDSPPPSPKLSRFASTYRREQRSIIARDGVRIRYNVLFPGRSKLMVFSNGGCLLLAPACSRLLGVCSCMRLCCPTGQDSGSTRSSGKKQKSRRPLFAEPLSAINAQRVCADHR